MEKNTVRTTISTPLGIHDEGSALDKLITAIREGNLGQEVTVKFKLIGDDKKLTFSVETTLDEGSEAAILLLKNLE